MAHLAVLVVAIVVVVYKVLGNRKIIDKEKSPNVYEFPKNTTKMHLAGREGSEGGGGDGQPPRNQKSNKHQPNHLA